MNKVIFSMALLAVTNVFGALQIKTGPDKPAELYRLTDMQMMNWYWDWQIHTEDYDGWAENNWTSRSQYWNNYFHVWVDGLGGTGSHYTESKNEVWDWQGTFFEPGYSDEQTWETLRWPTLDSGTDVVSRYQAVGTTNGTWLSWTNNSFPYIEHDGEHCVVNDPQSPPESVIGIGLGGDLDIAKDTQTYQRGAQTLWRLRTGGRALPQRRNLFRLTASVSEVMDKRACPPYVPPYYSGQLRDITNKTQIAVGSQGQLGHDGTLWKMLPDNADVDVTPAVKNLDFYRFNVNQQKYSFYINLATSTTNTDLSTNVPEVCVGQTVTLGAAWRGGIPPATNIDNVWWHLPEKYVNQQTNYSSTCTTYVKNPDLLTNTAVQCWYVNLPGGDCSVRETLHFANGQSVNIAARGNFTVYRPSISAALDANTTPSFFTGFHGAIPGIQLGGDGDPRDGGHAMTYAITYNVTNSPSGRTYTGNGGLVQLCTLNFSARPAKTFSDWRLDGDSVFYSSAPINPVITPTHRIPEITVPFTDSPQNYQPFIFSRIWVIGSFLDYCMFKPDGDGIYVSLGIVTWTCNGEVRPSHIGEAGFPDALIKTSDQVTGPTDPDDSDTFPVWLNTCPE